MRRRPPPSLSLQGPRNGGSTMPTSPSYSVPYTPSVYSHYPTDLQPRPSTESARSDESDTMQISSQLRQAWAEMQQQHGHFNDDDDTVGDAESVNIPSSEDEPDGSHSSGGAGGGGQFLDIEDADAPVCRLSVMGPKMKVLSKAPWESDSPDGDDFIDDDDDGELKDDMSEVASIFGRSLGHSKKSHERNRVGTPNSKSARESDHNNSKGWMGFVSRTSRTRSDNPPLKGMISAPLFASDPSSSTSPIHTHFQKVGTSSPDSVSSNLGVQKQQKRNAPLPRTDSLVSTTSSCVSSLPSPRSDRFHPAGQPPSPSRYLSSSSSIFPQQQPNPLPIDPFALSVRSRTSSVTDITRTSEDNGFHPFAHPEVYESSPRPHHVGGSNAAARHRSTSNPILEASALPQGSGSGIGPLTESVTSLTGTGSTTTITLSAASPSSSSVTFPSSPDVMSPSAGPSVSVQALGSGLSASLMADAAARASKISMVKRADSEVNMAGMQAHAYPGSPAYKLISLEQAQEKVRSRTKSGPAAGAGAPSTPASVEVEIALGGLPPKPGPNRKAASQGNLHCGSSEKTPGGRIVGESPPLPALPPSSNPAAPPSTSDVDMASSRNLKPKRSGFFKLFSGGGDKEKRGGESTSKAEQPHLPDGFVHVAMARSVSGFSELGIITPSGSMAGGRLEPSPVGSKFEIPPIPPIPPVPTLRRGDLPKDWEKVPSSVTSSSTISGPSIHRVRTPSADATPPARSRTVPTTPSLPTSHMNTSSNSKPKTETTPKRSWGTITKKASWARAVSGASDASGPAQQQHANKDALEFPSLQLRPMSGLFPSGLPVDLIGDSSGPMTVRAPDAVFVDDVDRSVKNGSSIGPGSGARRRPFALGIGIPEKGAPADVGVDLYSPVTASSLSSGRSTSVSVSTTTTATGPTTPASSRSLTSMQASHTWPTAPSSTPGPRTHPPITAADPQAQIQLLQDRLVQERKAWQLQRWELEAQIRELETQVAGLQAAPCSGCGPTPNSAPMSREPESVGKVTDTLDAVASPMKPSIMSRPRPRGSSTAKWVPA